MVNASSHIPIRLSRYVYVELVNPENETIDRVKIRPDEMNQFHGYISIPEDLPGGNYSLLAYTCYMLLKRISLSLKGRLHRPGKQLGDCTLESDYLVTSW